MESDVPSLNPFEDEEQAESVDSGCVADSTTDGPLDWKQVSGVLQTEYTYMMNLLKNYGISSNKESNSASLSVNNSQKDQVTVSSPLKQPPTISRNISSTIIDLNTKIKEEVKGPSSTAIKEENLEQYINKICSMPNSNEKLSKLQKLMGDLRKGRFANKLSKKESSNLQKRLRKKLAALNRQPSKQTPQKQASTASNGLQKPSKLSKPSVQIASQGGKLVFNKFDFRHPQQEERWCENKQKNLHNTLNQILKEKEMVKNLAAKGKADSAAQVIINKGWDNAMKKAQGLKIKDNAELLQKTLNRKKQKKQKSKRDWESRANTLVQTKQRKQQQRVENINSKRQRKADAKAKKSKKKSSRVPGF